jgi:hypothetical protein
MKKKTRNIFLISISILVALFFYGSHNFGNDRQSFREIVTLAGVGDLSTAFIKMGERKSFSNPIVNFIYHRWKKKMYARFISKEEVERWAGIVYDQVGKDAFNIEIELLDHIDWGGSTKKIPFKSLVI